MIRKLFIYHPISDGEYGLKVESFFAKKFDSKKKLYLIKELINKKENRKKIKTYFFMNKKNNLLLFFAQIIKFYLWAYINEISLYHLRLTADQKKINSNDIFYASARTALKYKPVFFLKKINCIKIFNLSHLEVETSLVSRNARNIGVDYFVFENNLTKNSKYFNNFFKFHKNDTLVLPHVSADRFRKKNIFKDRKNLCFASGRVHVLNKTDLEYKDFINFYKIRTTHPIRLDIYSNNNLIINKIDSFIFKTQRGAGVKDKYYNNFNIVDKYNEYKMFVAPEGINDTPPIGFVEGMTCGCVLFALNNDMYRDLDLQDGIHYVGYDGTLQNLLDKIDYYQKNEKELEAISINGYEFITKNFSKANITNKFIKFLNNIK